MQPQYDLISIGDSTIDVFMEVDEKDVDTLCIKDEERCVVCFEYGAKIPVNKMTRVAGVGNAANNAIGSTRLGLRSAIYTVLGSDKESEEIKSVLENEGVDTNYVVMESGKKANFATVINYFGERTIFGYHDEHNYQLPQLAPSKWIYYTSVSKGHEPLHTQIPEYIRATGAKMGFNPGSYQIREGLEKLKPILESTEVLILNREEAVSLVGASAHDIKGLMLGLLKTGPNYVVITDGRGGSYVSLDGREIWHAGIPLESPVVERTGCGDAYSTGFLAALVLGKEIPEAMLWGTMNSTSVIQHIGAREGLLTPDKMNALIKEYGAFAKPKMY